MGRVVDVEPGAIRPLRRVEYERMVQLGFFEDEAVELLEGTVVHMSPHGPAHDSTIQRLTRILMTAAGTRGDVRIQSAFAASDGSQPEPDASVVDAGDYDDAHPSSAWLIVEVSETSLQRDRAVKSAIYARSGVPEYWIVNLIDRAIEVATDPLGDRYGSMKTVRRGERFYSEALAHEIEVDAILR